MRKRRMIFQIEFFRNQDPEMMEKLLRRLSKEKRIPPFSRCTIMIDHKNLTQRNLKEEFPMMVDESDVEHKTES